MPSLIDPTTAMAPMHTVSDVVTKAVTNCLSPPLPLLALSHSPRRTIAFSIPSHEPMRVPAMSEPIAIIVPCIFTAPSDRTMACSSVP